MKILHKNTSATFALALTLALTTGLFLSGCSEQSSEQSTESSPGKDPALLARQAIDHAQEKYGESAQAGYAWAKSRTALNAATQALEAGDMETAIAEAQQATALAEASLIQAKAEQSAWLERFPKAPAPTAPATPAQSQDKP